MKLQNHNIKNWLNRIHFVLLIFVLVIFIARVIDIQNFTFIMPYYSLAGEAAAILFCAAMIPGSMQRFNFLKPVYSTLIYYRRQIGITFYVIANFHFTTRMSLHPLFNRAFELFYDPIIIAGSLALIILVPVYLTSNNWGIKYLKKYWKAVQRITYIAYFFITWHLYLVGSYNYFYLFLLTGIIIASSWVYHLLQKTKFFSTENEVNTTDTEPIISSNSTNEKL